MLTGWRLRDRWNSSSQPEDQVVMGWRTWLRAGILYERADSNDCPCLQSIHIEHEAGLPSCVLQCNIQYKLLVSLPGDIRKGREDTGSTSGGGE